MQKIDLKIKNGKTITFDLDMALDFEIGSRASGFSISSFSKLPKELFPILGDVLDCSVVWYDEDRGIEEELFYSKSTSISLRVVLARNNPRDPRSSANCTTIMFEEV